MALTPRQRVFAKEYLIDLNASAAVRRAGYSGPNAKEVGAAYMAKPAVQAAIQSAMAERSDRTAITADRVLRELAHAAFYDPADYANAVVDDAEVGITSPADIKLLPPDVRRAIIGWSWDKAGNFTLKLADKLAALDKLGRHLKLFSDKVELSGPGGQPLAAPLNIPADVLREVLQARADEV